MEDRHLYNKVMVITFAIIVMLLVAGIYSRSRSKKAEFYVPHGTVQEVEADFGYLPGRTVNCNVSNNETNDCSVFD